MSRKEAPRAGLLKALVAGRVQGREVAVALQVSERQVRRRRYRFEIQRVEGLPHPEPRATVAAVGSRDPPFLMGNPS